MCLDADSYLQPNSLKHAAAYFKDPQVVALSANVKIIDHPGLLNLVQKYEYLICYQMKRAQTLFNIEYIIGGIGSAFRKKVLDSINGYDGNTVTEDIDLTMKILQGGNKTQKVIYGADVIAMTESVLSISSLIRQRFRWKWGRSQTFLKNKNLFFNSDHRFSKALTFFYLPFAIFGDFAFLFEPLMLFYIIYVSARFHDLQAFISACAVISGYIIVNISLENSLTTKEKLKLITVAPLMYLIFYILSFVEYVALIKSLIKLPQLRQSLSLQKCNWDHVERFKSKTAIS